MHSFLKVVQKLLNSFQREKFSSLEFSYIIKLQFTCKTSHDMTLPTNNVWLFDARNNA